MFHRVLFEKKIKFPVFHRCERCEKTARFRGKLKNTIAVNSVIEHVQASRTILLKFRGKWR